MTISEQINDDVIKFLKESSTAVVATSFRNDVRASTVYFTVDHEFNFYFVTKRKTSKYLNAEMNPQGAIVVGTGPEHITVQAHGRIDLIVNEVEKQKIIDLLIGKQNLIGVKIWPIDEMKDMKYTQKVVFKITPDELYYMNIDSTRHPDTINDDYMKII